MFNKRILTPLLIILLLFSFVVMGAPTYVNVGPTTDFEGDVGVPDGSDYYINDVLFSTVGLVDISILAKTDGGIIVGDGTNFVLETGITARTSLGLGNVENLKVKLDATQAPTVNNDVDEGYAVGSRWCDITNDKEYVCLDNTDGSAVWTETTQSGGGGAFTDLTDTPASYTGNSLKHVRVNVGETALEFVTLGGGGDMLKATYDTDEDGDVDVAAGGTEKSAWTLYAIPYLSGTTAFGEITIGTAGQVLKVAAGATGYEFADESGGVDTSGTPEANDYARFTDVDTIEGRSYAEVKTDLDLIKCRNNATTSPTVNDDSDDGYAVNSVWSDVTNDKSYICVDATVGAAVWKWISFQEIVEDITPELGGEMDAGAHSIGFIMQTPTGDGTTLVDWRIGNHVKFTFGAQNETITFTNPTNHGHYSMIIVQDGTGSRTITWSGITFKWHGGVEPTLSTAANAEDVLGLIWDGTSWYGMLSNVFATL